MSENQPKYLTFFIPGILGSTLVDYDRNKVGEVVKREIWGENLLSNINTFRNEPSSLNLARQPSLQADKVIKSINAGSFKKVDVYGNFINFCTQQLNLIENQNFFLFAYDWRQDNKETARQFAKFINSKDLQENYQIRIIAHSMGGIVTRLMLLSQQNINIAKRTSKFFQIASPIKGSAKAYFTLKKHPNFDKLFDLLWKKFQDPDLRADLRQAMIGFPSIYQLLPPPNIKFLLDENGTFYSALDKQVWEQYLHEYINSAIDVHEQLTQPLNKNIQCFCAYSSHYPTQAFYRVQSRSLFNIDIIGKEGENNIFKVNGDETVIVSSADCSNYFDNDRENCQSLEINIQPSEHLEICCHNIVKEMLRREFL